MRRKNTAHGASRGKTLGQEQAPKGRTNCYETDSGGTAFTRFCEAGDNYLISRSITFRNAALIRV